MTENIEYQHFEQSSLPRFLRHDTWTWQTGLSLLCGIDPKESELFKPAYYYDIPYDEIYGFELETGIDCSGFEYWKVQLLEDRPKHPQRCRFANVDEIMEAESEWDRIRDQIPILNDGEKSFEELTKRHIQAASQLAEMIEVFFSNPDHNSDYTAPPIYFVKWAKEKNYGISWLDWAMGRGFLKETPDVVEKKESLNSNVHKRRYNNALKLIGALLKEDGTEPPYSAVSPSLERATELFGYKVGVKTVAAILQDIENLVAEKQPR